jgi:hypothetical protein
MDGRQGRSALPVRRDGIVCPIRRVLLAHGVRLPHVIYATAYAGLPPHEIGPLLGPLLPKPWHRRQLADEIKKATGA